MRRRLPFGKPGGHSYPECVLLQSVGNDGNGGANSTSVDCKAAGDLAQFQRALDEAAEAVVQQRIRVSNLYSHAGMHEEARNVLEEGDTAGEESCTTLKQLHDAENALSQRAVQCVRAVNVTALGLLNKGEYTRALQLLLDAEKMVQSGSGKRLPLPGASSTPADDSQMPREKEDEVGRSLPESPEPMNAVEGNSPRNAQEAYVPFFTKRHEQSRKYAVAVVENNIGLYHFKIGEYELAWRRMSRALKLEELLDVETIGVTYFNVAQVQYELGRLKSALFSISVAEETIEKRICDYQVQRTRAARVYRHNIASPDASARLEKKLIDIHVKWREEVCLLARVLDMHGQWLQRNNSFKAAMYRYEQSDRWLSSIEKLSDEEVMWQKKLRYRMQRCRRSNRHNACNSAARSSSPNGGESASIASPQSVIVTTTLPRRVELVIASDPVQLIKQEQEFGPQHGCEKEGRNCTAEGACERQRQASEGSSKSRCADLLHSSPYAKKLKISTPHTTATRPLAVHQPFEWDAGTSVTHSKKVKSSPTRGNSALFVPATPASKQSNASTVFSPFSESKDVNPHRRRLSSTKQRTGPSAGSTRLRPGCVSQGQLRADPHGLVRVKQKRSAKSFQSTGSMICAPSITWCVRTLQAFFRSRLAGLLRQQREGSYIVRVVPFTECSGGICVSYGGHTSVACMPDHRGGCCANIARTYEGNCVCARAKNPSLTRSNPRNACDVLLAFFSASRSSRLVLEKLLQLKYDKVIRGTCTQCVGALSPQKLSSADSKADVRRTLGMSRSSQMTPEGYYCSRAHAGDSPISNDFTPCGLTAWNSPCVCAARSTLISNETTASKRRGHCCAHQCEIVQRESVTTPLVSRGICMDESTGMTVEYVSGPVIHTHFTEASDSVDAKCCDDVVENSVLLSQRVYCSTDPHAVPVVVPQRGDVWQRDSLGQGQPNRHARRESGKTPCKTKPSSFTLRATVELMRHHALREEAAAVIQTAWREWRAHRQTDSV
ncbi:hypothetical protein TRVL_06471 [Trypanosoma vivax]|nr:hypothetical protein TRVL_06471 [Trypanosoma vivax]